jgi:hypothetical protein
MEDIFIKSHFDIVGRMWMMADLSYRHAIDATLIIHARRASANRKKEDRFTDAIPRKMQSDRLSAQGKGARRQDETLRRKRRATLRCRRVRHQYR